MLILLTLLTCAGIILLLAHADRRDALYDSPIAPATAEEKRWIALGYECALRDQDAKGKELAIDILRMRQEIEARAIAQVADWLEVQGSQQKVETAIALHELAEKLRTHGLEMEVKENGH